MITVIIPTCSMERFDLLRKTVKSIQDGTYKDVRIVIVIDGNQELWGRATKEITGAVIIKNENRKDWRYSINRVIKEFDTDYYIYASDDLFFPRNCIQAALSTMNKRFPDGFGVVGIGRKGKAPFGLIGKKWADHFPDRRVFCPDFIHYGSDREMYRIAEELGRFDVPEDREAQVQHARRDDETRTLARRIRSRDEEIKKERKEKGYKWGIDFNLVTEGKQ